MSQLLYDIRWALIFGAAAAAALVVAWRMELLVPAHVAAARRNLRARRMINALPLTERLGRRIPLLERLGRETSTSRLLIIGGKDDAPSRWWAATAGYGLIGMMGGTVLGLALGIPLVAGPATGIALVILRYLQLRSDAKRRQQLIEIELGDMLPMISALVTGAGMNIEEAIARLSRCCKDRAVYGVVHEEYWRLLVSRDDDPRTEWQILRSIGREFDVPIFARLSQTVRMFTETGLSRRREITELANQVFTDRLENQKRANARARVTVALPMTGLIIPLLMLMLFPLVASITKGFA
jgi:hypothetical protein